MTSHEYAEKLLDLVKLLQESEPFELPTYESEETLAESGMRRMNFFSDKTRFLAAVRSLGNGHKKYDGHSLVFVSGGLHLAVDRNAVCRIVKPAVPAEYECEPLLAPEEEELLQR